MKANKAVLLSLVAFACCANAGTVDTERAVKAAQAWANVDASFGVLPKGATVSTMPESYTDSASGTTNLFYAVRVFPSWFSAGGTLFLAADDRIGPVLAFSQTTPDALDLTDGSPLRTLLERDVLFRLEIASQTSDGRKMWDALTSEADEISGSSDLRVDALVQSQWGQGNVDKMACYNYSTPDSMPAGCVATSAAQIMRYWEFPEDARDWSSMTLRPAEGGVTEEGRRAIGDLIADIGGSIYLMTEYARTVTRSNPFGLAAVFRGNYQYGAGFMYMEQSASSLEKSTGLHRRATREKVIFASIDAKRPVQLAIHDGVYQKDMCAAVADGYGFITLAGVETDFVHINMGWDTLDDIWYSIPDIGTSRVGAYKPVLRGALFNVAPGEIEDGQTELVTGRVLDAGEPADGAVVTAYIPGTDTEVTNAVADANGVYALPLQSGASYEIVAVSADGTKIDRLFDPVPVSKTVAGASYTVTDFERVGNTWGHDLNIEVPYVKIGEKLYNYLDAALRDAAVATEPEPIVVFGPAKLRSPVTIATDITIATVPDAASDYPTAADCVVTATTNAVTAAGWAIQVVEGARLALSGAVFDAESVEAVDIDVAAGGTIAVEGVLGLGVINVKDADAFVLSGEVSPLEDGLSVAYAAADERFEPFGRYTCDYEVAAACAARVGDALNLSMCGSALEDGTLAWDRKAVDPKDAYFKATNDDIGTTYYMSLDYLFEDYAAGGEVVVLKDCPADAFKRPVAVSNDMTFKAADGAPVTVTATKDAFFNIAGAAMTVENVAFSRPGSTVSMFEVTDGGSLEFGAGAVIADLILGSSASAVRVVNGKFTMLEGSAITGCVQSGQNGGGAAVHLGGDGCSFDFFGGAIRGCCVLSGNGGGVFAALGSKVAVSGLAIAYGNTSGRTTTLADDLYFARVANGAEPMLTLAGAMAEGAYIGVNATGRVKAGSLFAAAAPGVAAADLAAAAAAFVNDAALNDDANDALAAEAASAGLVWKNVERPIPVPETVAAAKITVGDSSVCYADVAEAFLVAARGGDDARIELLKDATLSTNVLVASSIVYDGGGYALTRTKDCFITVTNNASLAVTNAVLDGGRGALRLFYVNCGALTLDDGAVITNVVGSSSKMVAPVDVWGGTFTMNPGAEIVDCANGYKGASGAARSAGAVVVTCYSNNTEVVEGAAYLNGGTIARCKGGHAGGVYIGNGARVEVRGPARVHGNTSLAGADSNLVVQDRSALVLAELLEGRIGFTEGYMADTEVLGIVDPAYAASTTQSNLVVSAHRFRRDADGEKAQIVQGGDETLLVWTSAVEDGRFVRLVDGIPVVYDLVLVEVDEDDEPVVVECAPFTFTAVERREDGGWRLVLAPGTEFCTYTLMASDDLADWTDAAEPKTLSAEDLDAKLQFVIEAEAAGEHRFWKVRGEDGQK